MKENCLRIGDEVAPFLGEGDVPDADRVGAGNTDGEDDTETAEGAHTFGIPFWLAGASVAQGALLALLRAACVPRSRSPPRWRSAQALS